MGRTRIGIAAIFGIAALGTAAPAMAQANYTYSIYVDSDARNSTGCSAAGVIGAEARIDITVAGGTSPQILSTTRARCVSGAFQANGVPSDSAAIGLNVGVDGSDVLEVADTQAALGSDPSPSLIFSVVATSANGSDTLATTNGAPGGGGIGLLLPFIPIPLLTWPALLLLVGLLAVFGARQARRSRMWRLLSLVFLGSGIALAANFIVDGAIGDWAGTPPLATDPAGDTTSGETAIDLRAFYAALENGKVFMRLDVTNVQNNPPTAVAGVATTLEDQPVAITLTGTDTENDPLTFSIVTPPSLGALGPVTPTGPSTATVLYTPTANLNGSDNFSFSVSDGQATSAPATESITVTAVNDAPSFLTGPNQSLVEDAPAQSITGWATAISAGPPNETGQVVSFSVSNNNAALFVTAPVVSSNGTLTYALAANANGVATVTVTAIDDGGTANGGVNISAPQTFTITATAVNDPPSFVKGADQTVLEDAAAQSIAGWATAISPGPPDESGQTVSFNLSNNNATLFSAAPVVAANGTLSYTLAANANGAATVTITAMDSGGIANGGVNTSVPQTFTITATAVNDAPSFVKGPDQNVLEDAAAQTIAGWATAISPGPPNESGQLVSFNVSNNNAALFASAPAVGANGTLAYTLAANANGTATVTVAAMDDGGTANGGVNVSPPQTFTIAATAVNDPPSFVKGADQTLLEDAAAQSVAGWATAISPGPPDEAGQTVSFNVSSNNAALFSVLPAVAANGTLSYALAADANGAATVTVTAIDSGGTASGGVNTGAPQTFTINVTAVNDAPSFVKGPDQIVLEDAVPQIVAGWATAVSPGPPNEATQVVSFDVSSNNAALFATAPAVGSSGTLTYTLAANASGSATVTLFAMDDGGTANGGVNISPPQSFIITVTAVNDAPGFVKGADQTVPEDSPPQSVVAWATAISPGPPDESGQTVSFNVTNNNAGLFSAAPAVAANGTLTYAVTANADGVATVSVVAMDSGGTANGGVNVSAPQNFTVTVTGVDDPPVAVDDTATVIEDDAAMSINVLANDTDVDGGPKTIASITQPVNGVVVIGSGSLDLAYTPNANYCNLPPGTTLDTFTYALAPGGSTATVRVSVTCIDDDPIAVADSATVVEDSGATVIDVLANDTDVDGGPKSIANVIQPVNGTVVITGGGTGLTYAPNANYCNVPPGTALSTFTYSLTPGGSAATVTVSVTCIDDNPVAVNDSATVVEGSAANAIDVLANDTDVDGGPKSISGVTQPANGTVVIIGGGTGITYQPNPTYCNVPPGTALSTFTYTLAPGGSTATVTVSVTCVDDPPVAVNDSATVVEDSGANAINVLANDTDVDGGPISIASVTQPANGTVVITGGGTSLTYAPNANYCNVPPGTALSTFTYTLAPGASTATVTVSVTCVNDAPVVDLNGPAAGTGFAATYTEGNVAVAVVDAAALAVIDVDNATLASGSVVISNIQDGAAEVLAATTTGTAITANYIGGTLSLSGTDTVANYQLVLRSVTYRNTSTSPAETPVRAVNFTVNDGAVNSATATSLVTVVAVNTIPSFTAGAGQTVLEDSGAQTVPSWATAINDNDGGLQTLNFTVTLATGSASLFAVAPAVSSTGTLSYTPAANANGTATFNVVLMDNGSNNNTSAAQTLTINVTDVNDVPSFSAGANQSVLEDAAAQTIAGWATAISAGPSDESGQTLTFTVSNNNASLFSMAPAVSPTGTLTYTPTPDANGVATVSVTLMDGGGTANGGVNTSAVQTFSITVTAVNDAPSFVKGADQAVLDNVGPQTVNPWATAISVGPANEAGQTPNFEITGNSAPSAFSAGPAVSPTGVLTYTPAIVPQGTTTATITLRVRDNGGTANGGVDASPTQTFVIAITHANIAPTLTNPTITYATAGNTQLHAGGATLPGLVNISDAQSALAKSVPVDPDGPNPPSVIAASGSSANGGNFSIATDGAFTYVPPADFNGTDTFTYQVTDGASPTPGNVTGTVSITVSQKVWYVRDIVDANNPAGGDGRSNNAFDTLAAAQAGSTANSIVFVFRGNTGTTPLGGGIVLKDGQKLHGEGIGLTVTGFGTLVPAGSQPRITNSGGNGVTIAASTANGNRAGVEVRGLDISGSTNAVNATSANAANLGILISNTTISAAGTSGINVTPGSTGTQTLAISDNTVTASGTGISVLRSAGAATITAFANNVVSGTTGGTGILISGPSVVFDQTPGGSFQTVAAGVTQVGNSGNGVGAGGILLTNVEGDLSFTDVDVFTDAGTALGATSSAAYTGSAGLRIVVPAGVSTLQAVGGPIAQLNTVTATLPSVTGTSTGSASGGFSATNLSGAVSFSATSSINGPTIPGGSAFQVATSNATISYAGSITTITGRGIQLTNNTGALINFSGPMSISSGTNPAFEAIGGGTVTVTGATSRTLTTTTATALNVSNTAIGLGGINVTSVSANGAGSGIILNNTGVAAGLTVTGTGAANSAGTIQNTTGSAVSLNTTYQPAFTNLRIQNSAGHGVSGTQVSGFSYVNGLIDNTGTGLGVESANIAFNTTTLGTENNLSGAVTITGNTLTNSYYHGVDIVNFNGTISDANISGNTITSSTSTATSKGSGIRLIAIGSASTIANVSRAQINNNIVSNFPSAAGILAQGGNGNLGGPAGVFGTLDSATNIISITGNRASGFSPTNRFGTQAIVTSVNGRGQGNFDISNNGTAANPIGNSSGTAIALSSFGYANVTGLISNNIIVANNLFGSQGIGAGTGATLSSVETPSLTLNVLNNSVSQTDGNGILLVARDASGTLRSKVQGNTVATPLGGIREGIRIDAGNAISLDDSVCVNIAGNTTSGSTNSGTIASGIGFRKQGTLPTTNDFSVNGMAATATPGVENFVGGLNPGSTTGNFGTTGVDLLSAMSGYSNCSLP